MSEVNINKSVTNEETLSVNKNNLIRDKYNFVLLAFALMGISVLMPYTSFLSQLGTFHTNETEDFISGLPLNSIIKLIASVPVAFAFLLNAVFLYKTNINTRIIVSYIIIIIFNIIMVIFIFIGDFSNRGLTLAILIIVALITNLFSTISQVAFIILLSYFPIEYLLLHILNYSTAGVISDILAMFLSYYDSNGLYMGRISSVLSLVISVLSLILFLVLKRTNYFTGSLKLMNADTKKNVAFRNLTTLKLFKIYFRISRKIKYISISVFLVFLIVLSYFPHIMDKIVSVSNNATWLLIFPSFMTFFSFDMFDLLGRLVVLFTYKKLFNPNSKKMIYLTAAMAIMLPFYLICNKQPDSNIPSLLKSDAVPIILNCIFGFCAGFYFSICIAFIHKLVESENLQLAYMFVTFIYGCGLSLGSILSFGFDRIIVP